MKILIIIDKEGTAIWRLANAVKRNLPQHQITILPVHPKRCDVDTMIEAQRLMKWCDVLDIHYWKSGQVLRNAFPKEFESKPKILFHFNPYDVQNEENQYYDKVVVNNQAMYDKVPAAYLIPMGIDLSFFKFNDDYTEEKIVNMSVARIEGKKGVKEVAQVCNELGYKLRLVGRVSKPDYMVEVMKAGGDNIEFIEDATDEQLREVYYSSAVHICNSIDNFESGCYDEKTEILTDKGWKFFKDLDKTELVATLNTEDNNLEYQKPIKYIKQDNHKELYSVDNRALSFAVTGNHNMWVATKTRKGCKTDASNGYKDYRFVPAEELPSGFKIQRTSDWIALNAGAKLDVNKWVRKYALLWFKFMGIYLAEGCVIKGSENSYRISISAVKKSERDSIRQLLNLMKFEYEELKDQFRIGKQNEIAEYLLQFGKAKDKYIPYHIKFGTRLQIDTFLDWYVKGDGRIFNGARVIYTSSKNMSNDLQECFIKAGTNANIKVRNRIGQKRWIKDHWVEVNLLEYIIYERNNKSESYIRRSLDLIKKEYTGSVYCVEVPKYHVLLVRREGTAYFCGNTLPILECMACGVPILTRGVGHVPELYDGGNIVINEGQPEDVENLKKLLKDLMENRDWRLKLRENGWNTVRGKDDRRMVLEINKLYYDIYIKGWSLISVIIPTKDKPDSFIESFLGALTQDYPKYEVVVVDSGDNPVRLIVEEARKRTNVPIKYIYFPNKGEYTLPKARNKGIIEADGEYILFCDDRIKMEPNAISVFEAHKKSSIWIWGMKDRNIKSFVENFSFVPREILIKGGMFNERIEWYGGTTQDIKERYEKRHNVDFVFLEDAKANQVSKSSSKRTKRKEIIEAKLLLYKMYGK